MNEQGLLRNRRLAIAAILMLALVIAILIAEILAARQPGLDTIINDAASVICASIASGFCISVWLSMSSQEVYKKIWDGSHWASSYGRLPRSFGDIMKSF